MQHDVGLTRNETYSPVVLWDTLHLFFIFSLQHNLHTTQIDFKNAFVQSSLPEPIYLELPLGGFNAYANQNNKILMVTKSLYRDTRALYLWYDHLRVALVDKGFVVSNHDPCHFLWKDCMLVNVDDACLAA